jgi:radical SAM protein with 4Fe4S-binding SPASM domain
MRSPPKQVFLFLCHFVSSHVFDEYKKIEQETVDIGDSVYLLHVKSYDIPPLLQGHKFFLFSSRSLYDLGYTIFGKTLVPGHTHFPLMQFFRENPDYDYYWVIEYDVRFSGKWGYFFNYFSKTEKDFLSSNIRTYQEQPDWYWWSSLRHPQKVVSYKNYLRSFNPIYRISKSSLIFLDDCLKNGWIGHYEILFPTLLYREGFSLMDFGGTGKFTPPELKNKFYTSSERSTLLEGTFRYRPVMSEIGNEKDKLYHPVKPIQTTQAFDFFYDFNIEINTSCNRRCFYCPNSISERGLIKNEKLMDIYLYYKLIDELSGINFTGRISPHLFGEPLLDRRLTELMKYTRKKLPKAQLVIYSNGDALSLNKFNELIDAGVDSFLVTQHGKTMSESMKSLYASLKNSPDKMRKMKYNHFNSMTPLFNRGGLVKSKILKTIPRCAEKDNPVAIDYNGNVILCCNDYFSTVKFGNIKSQRFVDIWLSDRYVKIRKQLKNKQYILPICLKCTGKVGPPQKKS